ncbi:Mitochondrial intermediate peptidase [Cyberlindnera fabianii]|uniref:Mitochondrial intermediate peptidase n=1 Tax=Cyberlindnera fabianii TaxID=36022 RepID=A0A1V2L9A6_CYBFA|nr:Mitochondrial intermediate peptidase [Cyberlindnera fabianii]
MVNRLSGVKPTTAFTSSKSPQSDPIDYSNDTIRKVFDDDVFWHNFQKSKSTAWSMVGLEQKETGLFRNPYLTSPSGLRKFSHDSSRKAQQILSELVAPQTDEGLKKYIATLDRLSDILCRVIDLAEFIRVAHPSRAMVTAAQECHEEMFEFMNILNTNIHLYENLHKVLNTERIRSALTDEEVQVGEILLADFLKSGITMDDETRNDFINISQRIAVLGQHFANGVGEPESDHTLIPAADMKGTDTHLLSQIPMDIRRRNYKIPTQGFLAHAVLRSSPNESVRKRVWIGLHSTSKSQVAVLEDMLRHRGILARVLGRDSYSSYQLEEKMAKKPTHVLDFLKKLAQETKKHACGELRSLATLKQRQLGQHHELSDEEVAEFLKPWDRDYFSTIYFASQRTSNQEQLSSYFSLGSVMQGLSNLFSKIYGIQLVPAPLLAGESWSNDVRRLDVVSENEGLIGVVYCDLFQRGGKTPNPAHFTVCCSRKIYADEAPEDLALIQKGTSPLTNEQFQLPVISLVCNFERHGGIGKCLLTLNEVETIFHEMGHAMHSMLGRTALHNTSGTRCATDFVELPSILMEHFAKDARVIQSFARHYLTDEPIPLPLLTKFQEESQFLMHSESYSQIKMALLDQLLHSDAVLSEQFDSTTLYHSLESKLRVFADTESNWQGKFGHLFGYGGSYYSYLLDRAIASKVWDHLFAENPLSRENGEKFKNRVLKWGGSRDPWLCVADVLDTPQISKGDDAAMKLIGETNLSV